MKQTHRYGKALRLVRTARHLSQEQLLTSGRTYVSELERGLKSPTLASVDEFAEALDVHPLTLLTLAYLPGDGDFGKAKRLLAKVGIELGDILQVSRA